MKLLAQVSKTGGYNAR